MECDFIVECDGEAARPALTGWEAVVFELDDDPAYFGGSESATAALAP